MLLIELTLDGVEEVLAFALDFLFRLLIFELVLQFFGLTLELARFILEVFFGLPLNCSALPLNSSALFLNSLASTIVLFLSDITSS